MTATLLDGKTTARAWRAELKERVAALAARGVTPGLAVVRVGEDPASAVYVANKEKACRAAGMVARTVHLGAERGDGAVLDVLDDLAGDPAVHGIIVQLPLPSGYDVASIQERVPPAKDVDGLHPVNQGLVALGRPRFVPATPCGIMELLRRYRIDVAGRHAVIVGRSAIVGRPLANLLSAKAAGGDATVTLCHSRTPNLPAVLRSAELLVAAVGAPQVIRAEHLQPGVVVVDVGINRVEDRHAPKGYRLVGDVDFDGVREVAAAITPVPGGVGPMTVAGVVHNTVVAAEATVTELAARLS